MLKYNKICWAVTWGNRTFISGELKNSSCISLNSPPTFERKKDAEDFLENKIKQFKETGWFTESSRENIKIKKVKVSIEAI